ncbi:RNA-directed DNA polymerase, eukaryota [Tanacetum coccineum]
METKYDSFNDFLIRSLWSKPYTGYAFASSVGASRGILALWDNHTFTEEHKIVDRNFVGVVGSWHGVTSKVGLVNIYAHQATSYKEALWGAIDGLISSFDVIWIIFGDFNVVRYIDERTRSSFDINEANSFNDFIYRSGLVDILLTRKCFTRFFHSLLKFKISNFMIRDININEDWCDAPDLIKLSSREHFASRFKELDHDRPSFCNPLFHRLYVKETFFLESSIFMDEVKEVDVWRCINYFESTGTISRGCNPSFIVLILKINDPFSFSDYRPISLIRCVYKIISKILANRLATVISSIIGHNQSAFIARRQIMDDCLIANEIVCIASIKEHKLLLFKVDFEKAFDNVNWKFLMDIMEQMGFGRKWRKWTISCISSASISVLINGSPSKEFVMERGLRQGDPLSLFLFLLVAKALQVSILDACNKILFKRVYLANTASGLKISLAKSRIFGIGVSLEDVKVGFKESQRSISWDKWKNILLDIDKGGMGVGSLFAKNLGLLGKWKWRFLMENEALWRINNKEFYVEDDGFGTDLTTPIRGGVGVIFSKPCRILKRSTLHSRTPLSLKSRTGRALNDLTSLVDLISNMSLSRDGSDKWSWSYEAPDCDLGKNHVWNSWIPRKRNQGGVSLFSDMPSCSYFVGKDMELVEELGFPPFSITNIALENIYNLGCTRLSKIIHEVLKCSLWEIWKWRNKIVNANSYLISSIKEYDIFPSIQRLLMYLLSIDLALSLCCFGFYVLLGSVASWCSVQLVFSALVVFGSADLSLSD